MTPAQVIHQRRLHVLALAAERSNVSEACRLAGVSRTRFYEWKHAADLYGPDALMPKDRRRPQQPNATPTHVVAELLTLAVLEPTLGCRQYADRLAGRGYQLSKSTVQKHLVEHQLGRRAQRVSRAAAVAAASGLVIDPVERDGPFGFCHYATDPGQLLAMDSFYVGHLKGVGKVYQLTAVDTFSRWAVIAIVTGPVNASHTIAFIDRLLRIWRRRGIDIRAVLTDNGPEWKASAFQTHLANKGLHHQRIPPRSPNHNAVCERFHGTMLQECWRPAFHRRRFGSIGQLQAEADSWLLHYNHRRRNHSTYMQGRSPAQLLDQHNHRNAS